MSAGVRIWFVPISGRSFAGLLRRSMPAISIESISTAGVLVAFLFAAAAGVTSRRGMQWLVVGVMFSCLPFISEAGYRWIAGQRGGYERNGVQRVRGTDGGP